MQNDWGVIGCAYMAQEYCKVLTSRGITPHVYSRDLRSSHVKAFETLFPTIRVEILDDLSSTIDRWIVCTNIDSHEKVCSKLRGRIYCEKPFSSSINYNVDDRITLLMNRRYYYWTEFIGKIIDSNQIVKIFACIPEKNAAALISQSIHVIDLLWYLAGSFGIATRIGNVMPSFSLCTEKGIPVIINMNYGSHENFSIRFYCRDGNIYEAKPLEVFNISEGMEIKEPDAIVTVRTYRPIVRPFPHLPTGFKPGVSELVDDLLSDQPRRLPTLREHRTIHSWMEGNMA